MSTHRLNSAAQLSWAALFMLGLWLVPELSVAQTSPFQTGATALQTNILTLATPVAVILVMVLGIVRRRVGFPGAGPSQRWWESP